MSSTLSVYSTAAHLHNKPRHHPHHHQHMDRMDAARALLGVAPSSSSTSAKQETSPETDKSNAPSPQTSRLANSSAVSFTSFTFGASSANSSSILTPCLSGPATRFNARTGAFEPVPPKQQPSSNSLSPLAAAADAAIPSKATPVHAALDALVALASCEHEQPRSSSSSIVVSASASGASSDEEIATETTTTTTTMTTSSSRYDAEVMPPPPPRTGVVTRGRRRAVSNPEGMEKWAPPLPSAASATTGFTRRHFVLPASILEEELAEASAAMEAHNEQQRLQAAALEEEEEEEEILSSSPSSLAPISGLMSEEEQANLTPEELLKKARSRLLEDLSEGTLNGEKGVLTLPHSLNKYKEVYNKNGRIGIYTPAERSAIIARFQSKRSRRVWNKKIRYNCRKNLADRRMRVKGRFVKRSTEQEQPQSPSPVPAVVDEGSVLEEPLEATQLLGTDEDMPDVNDPEAGFCPTDDLPYRRTRRHTIT